MTCGIAPWQVSDSAGVDRRTLILNELWPHFGAPGCGARPAGKPLCNDCAPLCLINMQTASELFCGSFVWMRVGDSRCGRRVRRSGIRRLWNRSSSRPRWHVWMQGWCERRDSNPHGLPRQILSLVRLPIPPLSRLMSIYHRSSIAFERHLPSARHLVWAGLGC